MLMVVAVAWTKGPAWATPIPVKMSAPEVLKPLKAEWEPIVLRLDVRNLTGPQDEGVLPKDLLRVRISQANIIWAQCGIRFVARSIANVSAVKLKVPYEPQGQNDLSTIASALNPNGFDEAIPFTLAGPWRFSENGFSFYGLGWVFTRSDHEIDRIGAMIGAQRIHEEWAPQLISHELGHAMSLQHSPDQNNVMAGGDRLTPEQCDQSRDFAQASLKKFTVAPDSTPKIDLKLLQARAAGL